MAPRFLLIAAALTVAVFTNGTGCCEEPSEQRHSYTTASLRWLEDCTELPVLQYRSSRGHFGEWISDSNIDEIFIWKDGTIAWSVLPEGKSRTGIVWYHSTVPAEKVESAVQEITEDFAKYPSEKRLRRHSIVFRLDAQSSPGIEVYSQHHYEFFWVDFLLWKFYKENREVLLSDDTEAIINTIKGVGGFPPGKINADGTYTGLHPAWKFDYRGLVEYYRDIQPHAGLSAPQTADYGDEEILKCVEFYIADVGHLMLMEKKILDLLSSTDGLEAEKIFTRSLFDALSVEGRTQLGMTPESRFMIWHNFHVEREIKEGKSEFFYSPITEKEKEKIWETLRAKKAQE